MEIENVRKRVNRLTRTEKRIIDEVYGRVLTSRKVIASVCKDDWPRCRALVAEGILESEELIDDIVWWLSDIGIEVARLISK